MSTLNCRLGDLAIAVRAELPENLGAFVRIVGVRGLGRWWGHKTPIFLWEVEAIEGCRLVYEHANGEREHKTTGLIPDAFLKPLAPTWVAQSAEEKVHVS